MASVVFMGTPLFARRVLEQLYEEDVQVAGVVSQPDALVGRKKALTETPVHQLAAEHGTPVFQPEKIREDFQAVLDWKPDLILTCAYGQFLPEKLLRCAPLGSFNLHASLLPKYRGGAPIQRAIMNGETATGMTLMKMDRRMDAGDIIAKKKVDIGPDETYGQLEMRLMECAAQLLHEQIGPLVEGTYPSQKQDESQMTLAPILSPEEERIDFSRGYRRAYDQIRALIPHPGGYAYAQGRKIKFWEASRSDLATAEGDGTILSLIGGKLAIACGGKVLLIGEVQMEGKKRCRAKDFWNGAGRHLAGVKLQ